jgi:uncharacterized damage-inducible protein DinB
MAFPEIFSQASKRNYRVIKMQTEGLSDEDSLIQPPFRGNCLNWVLGHIIYHRGRLLKVLEDTSDWPEALIQRYKGESEPVLGPAEDILPLTQLLSLLDQSQERIVAELQSISAEALNAVVFNEKSREELIVTLQWHETHHIGQLEFLRQLAGKNDKVI